MPSGARDLSTEMGLGGARWAAGSALLWALLRGDGGEGGLGATVSAR